MKAIENGSAGHCLPRSRPSRSDASTATVGFIPRERQRGNGCRRVATAEPSAFAADRRSAQPSLRDGTRRNGSCCPWVETPGYHQSSLRDGRRGFTLVELLVVLAIIGILAGMSLGALAKAREAGKLAATKATIAKLNDLVMKRYESYRTRRVQLVMNSTSGGSIVNVPLMMSYLPFPSLSDPPQVYRMAKLRMLAIRDLMRAEMPDRWSDITNGPTTLDMFTPLGTSTQVKVSLMANMDSSNTYYFTSSLQARYLQKYENNSPKANSDHQQAKCLYLWLMTAMPEAKALFRPEEINMNYDGDGWPVFVDGWGKPIGFLRWAPGATAWSDIQIDDTPSSGVSNPANLHHDPFDPTFIQNGPSSQPTNSSTPPYTNPYLNRNAAYQMYPLIFAGVLGKTPSGIDDYGIALGNGQINGDFNMANVTITTPPWVDPDPYGAPYVNSSGTVGAILPNEGMPRVTNHHMEQR